MTLPNKTPLELQEEVKKIHSVLRLYAKYIEALQWSDPTEYKVEQQVEDILTRPAESEV